MLENIESATFKDALCSIYSFWLCEPKPPKIDIDLLLRRSLSLSKCFRSTILNAHIC